MAKKYGIQNLIDDNNAFCKADIYGLINDYTNSQLQQKSYDDVLRKILPLFQSAEFIEKLEGTELEAYNQYIMPLIAKEKNFPFVTGIFFASLITLIAPAVYTDEYMDDLTKGRLASDVLSEGWITKIEEYQRIHMERYLENEYNIYNKKIKRELNNASESKQKKIIQEYIGDKASFKEQWYEINQLLWLKFYNLNSICYHLAMINFNVMYQEKLENTLIIIKSLTVEKKEKIFNEIKNEVDSIHEKLCRYIADWDKKI